MNREEAKRPSSFVRTFNKKRLYDLIRRNEGISRAELTRMVDLTPTSVGKIIGTLIDEGLVAECGLAVDGKIGRNAIQLSIRPEKVLTIAVDADVGWVCGAVVDINRNILARFNQELPAYTTQEQDTELLALVINTLWDGLTEEQRACVRGIGISTPGIVDHKRGFVVRAPQINWENYPMVEALRSRLHADVPIIANNNVKAEAMAECIYGTGDRHSSAFVLSFGSGMGSAFISAGRVQMGSHNTMGEIGHILVGSNGIKCSCGRYGCLRTHIARTSIEERVGMDLASCVAAAQMGDPLCTDVLEEAVRYSAIWLSNCINLYDPEIIYLSGSMLEVWPDFYERVEKAYRQYMFAPLAKYEYPVRRSFISMEKNHMIVPAAIVFYQYLLSNVQIDRGEN